MQGQSFLAEVDNTMSGHTENLEVIKSDAFKWILGAGGGALALSIFLAVSDYQLSHSDRERQLGQTLKELRTAQSSMVSRVTDPRQSQPYLEKLSNRAE